MPDEAIKFPEFPELYNEEDEKHKQELERLAEEQQKIWKTQFAPEVWEKTPFIEKAAREIAGFTYDPPKLIRGWTPWEEFGFTPEQADEYIRETESELGELRRREQVALQVPAIRDYLTAMAVAGLLTGDEAQLYELIPQLNPNAPELERLDVNEAEREYFVGLNKLLAGKTKEEIDRIYLQEGFPMPKTWDEFMELIDPLIPKIEPRFIMSTVAFSKDVQEIGLALQQAYPPQAGEEESLYQKNIDDEFRKQGLVPTGDIKKDVETLEETRAERVRLEGKPSWITLEDGTRLSVIKKYDGFYEPESRVKIANIDEEGNPVSLTPEEEYLVDRGIVFLSRDNEIRAQLKRFGVSFDEVEKILESTHKNLTPEEWFQEYRQEETGVIAALMNTTIGRQIGAGYGDLLVGSGGALSWMGWEGMGQNLSEAGNQMQAYASPMEHPGEWSWEQLWNPRWWSYYGLSATRSLPFTMSILPSALLGWVGGTSLAVGLGLGTMWKVILGGMGGALLSRPIESGFEAGLAYDSVISQGGSDEEAKEVAKEVFTGNLALAGLDAAQIAAAFAPIPGGRVAGLIAKGFVRTARVAGRMVVIGLTEAGEEVYQEVISKRAAGEEIVKQDLIDVAIIGGMMGIGMGGGGDVLSGIITDSKKYMTPKQTQTSETTIKEVVEKALAQGKDKVEAEAAGERVALEELAETEEGAKLIEEVTVVAVEQQFNKEIKKPENRVHTKEVGFLQGKLESLDSEIKVIRDSHNTQSTRLETMKEAHVPEFELVELKESLSNLESMWKDLNTKKGDIQTQIEGLLGVTEEVVTPAVPTEEAVPMVVTAYRRGIREGAVGAGTFYHLEKVEGGVPIELTFKNVLKVSEEEVGAFIGLPSESLATKWFPDQDFGAEEGITMDRMVAEEAVRRGYDAIQYGNREIQSLVELLEVKPVAMTEESWAAMTPAAKETAAKDAGIASTATKLSWAELTSVQQEKLGGVPVVTPTAPAVVIENLTPDQIVSGEAIQPEPATTQANYLVGLAERLLDVGVLAQDVESMVEFSREQLVAADMDNPLSVAMVSASRLGSIPEYAKLLPSDVYGNVSQEFKDAEFADSPRWNLNIQPVLDAVSVIDRGFFGGALRRKVFQVAEQAQVALSNFHGGWGRKLINMKKDIGLDRPHWWQFGEKKTFNKITSTIVRNIGIADVIKSSEELLEKEGIAEVLKGVSLEDQLVYVEYGRQMRMFFDEVVAEANSVRVKLGREPIEYLEDYLPEVYKTNIWGRFLGIHLKPDFLKEQAMAPDFIQPETPWNPRALQREGGLEGYEKVEDVDKLFMDYALVMGKEMFYAPAITNAKAHAKVLREKGLEVPASYIEDWALRTMVGVPDPLTRWRKENIPNWIYAPMRAVRNRLNPAVFGLNLQWNLFVQTSSLALASLTIGNKYVIRATIDLVHNSEAREWIKNNVPAYIIKQRGRGSIVHQDLGTTFAEARQINLSPLETVDNWVTYLTRKMEEQLNLVTAHAAKLKGESLGLTGDRLVAYASDGAAKTQSMYDPMHLPQAYSEAVRFLVPFQTFSFEALTRVREMANIKHLPKAGAYESVAADSIEGRGLIKNRIKHFLDFIVLVWVVNMAGEFFNDRQPWEWSSFAPGFNIMMMGVEPSNPWNLPLPARYSNDLITSMEAIVEYDNWEPISSFMLRWHFPAGGQAERMVEGMIAASRGEHQNVAGDEMFVIDPEEYLKVSLLGVWSAEEGKEYIRTHFEGEEPRTSMIIKDVAKLEPKLGQDIDGEYNTLGTYGSDVMSLVKDMDIPYWRLLEDEIGLSILAKFRIQCGIVWEEFDTAPDKHKLDLRKQNPYLDATLYFWERTSTLRSNEAKEELEELFRVLIPDNLRAHWRGLPDIPDWVKLLPE